MPAPTPIVFPTSSAPGLRPQEAGGRLINAFAEKTPLGAPSQVIIRRSPGLEELGSVGSFIHTRGFLDISLAEVFWILNERVFKFDIGFNVTDLGPLSGAEPVTLARNNAVPPNYVVVTGQGCFNLFSNSAPTMFADIDLPAGPTSVCDFDGYFVWSFGNGQVWASDLNSVNVNAASFNTEQGLFARRVVRYAGRLYVFGDKWTGVYRDAGTIPFPFAREVTIPRGIIGTHAIAGWEAGWANQLIWVGDDFVVYKLDGYTPTPISTDDVSRDVQSAVLAGDRDLIEAYVYMFEKNPFWVVNCHERWTWEYNLSTGEWNERKSYNRVNWKGMKSIRVFDRWVIGDEYTGQLYGVNGNFFFEGDDPLIWHVESGVLNGFPRGIVVPRASFNVTTGVGIGSTPVFPFTVDNTIVTADSSVVTADTTLVTGPRSPVGDPLIEISWSLDGGYTYGEPVLRRLGGHGQTNSHPYVLNCGLSRGQGIRYRLVVSDPVHVGLSSGVVEGPQIRGFSG
jgi:hypothetical protein